MTVRRWLLVVVVLAIVAGARQMAAAARTGPDGALVDEGRGEEGAIEDEKQYKMEGEDDYVAEDDDGGDPSHGDGLDHDGTHPESMDRVISMPGPTETEKADTAAGDAAVEAEHVEDERLALAADIPTSQKVDLAAEAAMNVESDGDGQGEGEGEEAPDGESGDADEVMTREDLQAEAEAEAAAGVEDVQFPEPTQHTDAVDTAALDATFAAAYEEQALAAKTDLHATADVVGEVTADSDVDHPVPPVSLAAAAAAAGVSAPSIGSWPAGKWSSSNCPVAPQPYPTYNMRGGRCWPRRGHCQLHNGVDKTWWSANQYVALPSTMPSNPVVIQGMWSLRGGHDCVARTEVQLNHKRVRFALQEPRNMDMWHVAEQMSGWLVGQAGVHCMDNVPIDKCSSARMYQMGTKSVMGYNGYKQGLLDATSEGPGWVTVDFEKPFGTDVDLVVVAHMMTAKGAHYAEVRIKDVNIFGFKMIIEESDGFKCAACGHKEEMVAWLAIPKGTGKIGHNCGNKRYQAMTYQTTKKATPATYRQNGWQTSSPTTIIASVQTYNDAEGRYAQRPVNLRNMNPIKPSGGYFQLQLRSAAANHHHTPETIGIVMFWG